MMPVNYVGSLRDRKNVVGNWYGPAANFPGELPGKWCVDNRIVTSVRETESEIAHI